MPQQGSGLAQTVSSCRENFKQFTVRKLDAHSPAYVPLLENRRVSTGMVHPAYSTEETSSRERNVKQNGRQIAGGRRPHDRADEMRAAVFALAALEIAIAGGWRCARAAAKYVGVHADAHAGRPASRHSKTGPRLKILSRPSFFGL